MPGNVHVGGVKILWPVLHPMLHIVEGLLVRSEAGCDVVKTMGAFWSEHNKKGHQNLHAVLTGSELQYGSCVRLQDKV